MLSGLTTGDKRTLLLYKLGSSRDELAAAEPRRETALSFFPFFFFFFIKYPSSSF